MTTYSFHTYAADALGYNPKTGKFTLSADYDYKTDRNYIEYTDDDGSFDGDYTNNEGGDDANQTGTAYDDQGKVIKAGSIYIEQYGVLEGPKGEMITIDRIEINGVHVGYIPSAPLTPGVAYEMVGGGNVGRSLSDGDGGTYDNTRSHNYYESNSVPCFAVGTLILTPEGVRPVEALKTGDLVETLHDGPQPVIWCWRGTQCLRGAPREDKPVLIRAGALGAGCPERDLVVSPQHRMVVGEVSQGTGWSNAPALAPAKALVEAPGVRHMAGKDVMEWAHIGCAAHQVIRANGAWSETILLGTTIQRAFRAQDRLRLAGLYPPENRTLRSANGVPILPCLSVGTARERLEVALARRRAA